MRHITHPCCLIALFLFFTVAFLHRSVDASTNTKVPKKDFFSDNTAQPRDAGILYEIWHTGAAHLMHRNKRLNLSTLTVERVIQSDGNLTLNDVFPQGIQPGFIPDIYNVEPQLGESENVVFCLREHIVT